MTAKPQKSSTGTTRATAKSSSDGRASSASPLRIRQICEPKMNCASARPPATQASDSSATAQ